MPGELPTLDRSHTFSKPVEVGRLRCQQSLKDNKVVHTIEYKLGLCIPYVLPTKHKRHTYLRFSHILPVCLTAPTASASRRWVSTTNAGSTTIIVLVPNLISPDNRLCTDVAKYKCIVMLSFESCDLDGISTLWSKRSDMRAESRQAIRRGV